MELNKKIRVPIENTDRYLEFKRVINNPKLKLDNGEIILGCCEQCCYSKFCSILPDPRNLQDDKKHFIDFCRDSSDCEINFNNNDISDDIVPVENTIEDNLGDIIDINKVLIKNDKLIRISKVIDCICKNMCDSYREDHSGCSKNVRFCILKVLFDD